MSVHEGAEAGHTAIEAALITRAGTVDFRRFCESVPLRDEVVVDIILCGVCAAEVKSFRGESGHGPSLCGHEWVGRVAEIGQSVTAVKPGSRVVVAVPAPCEKCIACRHDRPQSCSFVMTVARGQDAAAPPHGGFARQVKVADYRVLPAHRGLSDVEAALVEPAAVAFHGVRRSNPTPGEAAVVLGAGPIGQMTAQLVKEAGADTVIVVEPSQTRRRVALGPGVDGAVEDLAEAERVLERHTPATGPDVVYDCAGADIAVQQAVDLVRPGGRVVLIGDALTATIAPRSWLAKEVTVLSAAGYSRRDIQQVMELMATGRLSVEALHTRTISLDQLGDTLQEFSEGRSEDVKVLVDPRALARH